MTTHALTPNQRTVATAGRVASAASALFAVTLFFTVASVNVPYQASGAKLLAWWQKDSSLTEGTVSMFFAIASAILFIVAVNHVRALLPADGRSSGPMQFAHSMATAFSVTLLVSGALRGTISHLVKVDDEPLPGLDVLRYATALNYTLLGTVVMTLLALTILGISAVVFSTRILARWMGVLGIVCGLIIIGAVAASVGAFAIPVGLVWALGLAVALWRQPSTV